MKRTIKVMAIDLLIFLPLIYFGLFKQVDVMLNVALALLWFISIAGIAVGIFHGMNDAERKKEASKWKSAPTSLRAYRKFSAVARVVAIFAAGYFWLGGFFLASTILMWANRITTKEESK